MPLKCLVSGSSGFIGSHLKQALQIAKIPFNGYDLIDGCDITDRLRLYNTFTQEQYDIVIHLAALTSVKRGELFPQEMIKTNIEGTFNLIDICHKFGVKKFIYFSSSSVLGGNKDINKGIDETVEYFPISMYGITKAASEMLFKANGLEYVIIRPFSVYGENGRQDQVIYRWINQIKKEKPITFYGDGSSMRGYTYIGDLIDATIKIINADWKLWRQLKGQIIHLGGNEIITLRQLWEIVEDFCKENLIRWTGIETKEMPKADIICSYADTTKAKKLLGFDPKPKFREIVNEILKKELLKDTQRHCL